MQRAKAVPQVPELRQGVPAVRPAVREAGEGEAQPALSLGEPGRPGADSLSPRLRQGGAPGLQRGTRQPRGLQGSRSVHAPERFHDSKDVCACPRLCEGLRSGVSHRGAEGSNQRADGLWHSPAFLSSLSRPESACGDGPARHGGFPVFSVTALVANQSGGPLATGGYLIYNSS